MAAGLGLGAVKAVAGAGVGAVGAAFLGAVGAIVLGLFASFFSTLPLLIAGAAASAGAGGAGGLPTASDQMGESVAPRRRKCARLRTRTRSKNVFMISNEGVGDAVRDGLRGANHSNSLAIARICNDADRPKPRPHTHEEIVNTF